MCNGLVSLEIFESEAHEQWLEDERSGASEEFIEAKRETEEIMGSDSANEEESSEEESSEEESDD